MQAVIGFVRGVILLVGCAQQQPPPTGPGSTPGPNQTPPTPPPQLNQTPPEQNQTPAPPENATPAPPTSVRKDQIYKYELVNSFEYVLVSKGNETTIIQLKTNITSETIDGAAAWLEQTEFSVPGPSATAISKMWVDKITHKCLKETSVITYGGQQFEQTVECSEGLNLASWTGAEPPVLNYAGEESVTVPAGTFDCSKYSTESVTYWITSSVPIPVKIAYNDGTITMQLVSYT